MGWQYDASVQLPKRDYELFKQFCTYVEHKGDESTFQEGLLHFALNPLVKSYEAFHKLPKTDKAKVFVKLSLDKEVWDKFVEASSHCCSPKSLIKKVLTRATPL